MSREKRIKKEKIGYIDKIVLQYYQKKLSDNIEHEHDEYEIINPREASIIRKEYIKTSIIAALLGMIGVLALYIPKYQFPDLFELNISYKIPILNIDQNFEWFLMTYSIILAQLEAYFLVYYNVKAVANIAKACGFPVSTAPDYDAHIKSLSIVAMEKKDKTIKQYGIDPFFGLSKMGLFVYMLIVRFKATISNMFVKLVVGRIAGRAVLRVYIDMIGLIIYPIWNIIACIKVIHESKLRIMAPNLIKKAVVLLHNEFKNNDTFKEHIYNTLDFLSQIKRNYNYNLYLLTDAVINTFNITQAKSRLKRSEYLEFIGKLHVKERSGIIKILILGMLIDGELSRKEQKVINEMQLLGIITYNASTVKQWCNNFTNGKGLDDFFSIQDYGHEPSAPDDAAGSGV